MLITIRIQYFHKNPTIVPICFPTSNTCHYSINIGSWSANQVSCIMVHMHLMNIEYLEWFKFRCYKVYYAFLCKLTATFSRKPAGTKSYYAIGRINTNHNNCHNYLTSQQTISWQRLCHTVGALYHVFSGISHCVVGYCRVLGSSASSPLCCGRLCVLLSGDASESFGSCK